MGWQRGKVREGTVWVTKVKHTHNDTRQKRRKGAEVVRVSRGRASKGAGGQLERKNGRPHGAGKRGCAPFFSVNSPAGTEAHALVHAAPYEHVTLTPTLFFSLSGVRRTQDVARRSLGVDEPLGPFTPWCAKQEELSRFCVRLVSGRLHRAVYGVRTQRTTKLRMESLCTRRIDTIPVKVWEARWSSEPETTTNTPCGERAAQLPLFGKQPQERSSESETVT